MIAYERLAGIPAQPVNLTIKDIETAIKCQ